LNIVHLTTFHNSGAGIAATQLHNALLDAGMNSSIIFVQHLNEKTDIPNSYSLSKPPTWLRLKNKWKKIIAQNKIEAEFKSLKPAISAEFASLPFSHYDVLQHPAIKKADIVHLHWIAGMIDYTAFFKRCEKNLVWTLHDMNPLSGLFFYKEDEMANDLIAAELNKKILDIKLKAFNSIKTNIQLTSPSAWLAKEANKSLLLERFKCIAIPNIIDLHIFSPEEKNMCRSQLNIKPDALVLLFTAMSVSNKRKGFDLLMETLKMLQSNIATEIIAIGKVDEEIIKYLPVKFVGEIKDKALLAKYYSAADVFILPSREDNLPNTMLESFACGLPVVGFPVGGIKEYVIDGKTGYLAKDVSSTSLKEVIEKFIENRSIFSSERIRNFAEENFSRDKVIPQFQKLYSELISKK
jgi:glycosyltransferase involved in cell wall biosynthesis